MYYKSSRFSILKDYLIFTSLISLVILFMPMIVYSKPTEILAWVNADTSKSLSHNLTQISPYKGISGIQKKTKFDNFTINTALNLDKTQKLTFDHSYIEYKNKNKTIGIGKINRHWSFSPFTSLILSSNAPPSNSFYLVINKNKKSSNTLFSLFGPWSIEIFNSFTSDTTKTKNPMLLGFCPQRPNWQCLT